MMGLGSIYYGCCCRLGAFVYRYVVMRGEEGSNGILVIENLKHQFDM